MGVFNTIYQTGIYQSTALKKICKAHKVFRTKSSTAVDLVYKIYGPCPMPNNDPVMVLHGVLGSKRNWQTMCNKISEYTNKPVIAVDARNHGDSPHHAAHSYFDLAADVSQLLTKLTLRRCNIIGHSMGGRTGMVLALTEPTKVASLVVVDISPIPRLGKVADFFPKLMNVMMSVDFRGADTLKKAKFAATTKFTETKLFTNEDAMYFVLMNIGQLPDNSFGWKCNVDALQKNFPQIASFPKFNNRMYSGRTLFLGGALSDFIPHDDIIGIRRLFPKAQLIYIKGAGHNIHADDPEAFFNTVLHFLSYSTKNKAQL